jgi:prevent-host-death family protein
MARAAHLPMQQLNSADLRSNIADTVNRVAYGHERILLTRRGQPLAALVSLADLERLRELERRPRARPAGR